MGTSSNAELTMTFGRAPLPAGTSNEVVIPTPKVDTPLAGRWRITWMETWAQEDVDLVGPGEIFIGDDGFGSMSFIVVECDLHVEPTERDDRPAVEWSWYGSDDGHEQSGRGWAVLEADGTLKGKVYIHRGDDSAFTAARVKA